MTQPERREPDRREGTETTRETGERRERQDRPEKERETPTPAAQRPE